MVSVSSCNNARLYDDDDDTDDASKRRKKTPGAAACDIMLANNVVERDEATEKRPREHEREKDLRFERAMVNETSRRIRASVRARMNVCVALSPRIFFSNLKVC